MNRLKFRLFTDNFCFSSQISFFMPHALLKAKVPKTKQKKHHLIQKKVKTVIL